MRVNLVGICYLPDFERKIGDYDLYRSGNFGVLFKPQIDYSLTKQSIQDDLFTDTQVMATLTKDHSFISFQPGTCLDDHTVLPGFCSQLVSGNSSRFRDLGQYCEMALTFEPIVEHTSASEPSNNYLVDLALKHDARSQQMDRRRQILLEISSTLQIKFSAKVYVDDTRPGSESIHFIVARSQIGAVGTALSHEVDVLKINAKLTVPGPLRIFAPELVLSGA